MEITDQHQKHVATSPIPIWFFAFVSGVLILSTAISLIVILSAHRQPSNPFGGVRTLLDKNATSNDLTNELSFTLPENALTVGDLILLWGKPDVRLYCETTVMSWPTFHIVSLVAPSRTGKLDYFASVVSVYFTHGRVPQSLRILTNDLLHDCGGAHRLHSD